jgi:SAM-dependent methyltransferase
MTPQQIAENYDKLASHWNSDEFNRTNGIAQHKRAIRFAPNKRNAIDIGCGSSGRIIDLMISEGFDAEGLDISTEMIRMAKQRHPDVVFHHADICSWHFPKKYDLISAWDSIWHAPLAEHEAILKKLCEALSQGGILIFTSGGVDQPEDVTNPCMGQPLYHAALGIPKLLEIVSECGCICRHLEYDQYPELHLYLIIQKAEHFVDDDLSQAP